MVPDVTAPAPSDDPVLDALDQILGVGRANVTSWMLIMDRIERIRKLRHEGVQYAQMTLGDETRLIDELADNHRRLSEAIAQLRNASIVELRDEGMSVAEIARGFGVSRQWVSRLLGELTGAQPELPSNDRLNQDKSD